MVKAAINLIRQYIRKLDKTLFLSVCLMSGFSVVMLYSMGNVGMLERTSIYKIQLLCVCAGIFAALVISAFDYHKFAKLWFLYMPFAVGLNLLTFVPSLSYQASEIINDNSSISIGFTTIKPSEILKVAFILSFSLHLSKVRDKINHIVHMALLCLHGAFPIIMVLIEGDDGTALVFMFMFLFMIFAAGISWKYILSGMAALPPALWFLWNYFMKPHQKMRIIVLFQRELAAEDPAVAAAIYQQERGLLALGSGKLFGKGVFPAEYVYVPESQNDFIFTYIGQCLGFIGCMAVVLILAYICIKTIVNSQIARDDLGKYICVGVFGWIFTQCVLNIGMVLFVFPVIGIPLPFLSQGGTSMLALFAAVGIVLSTYSHSEKKYRVFYDYE